MAAPGLHTCSLHVYCSLDTGLEATRVRPTKIVVIANFSFTEMELIKVKSSSGGMKVCLLAQFFDSIEYTYFRNPILMN